MFFSTKENREEDLISGCRVKMWLEKIHATFTDNGTKKIHFDHQMSHKFREKLFYTTSFVFLLIYVVWKGFNQFFMQHFC